MWTCKKHSGGWVHMVGVAWAMHCCHVSHHVCDILQAGLTCQGSSWAESRPRAEIPLLLGTGDLTSHTAYMPAQGTVSAEVQAVQQARDAARGSTAYLNLESGDCHGDTAAVQALLGAGVSRVVMGMRHPLAHARGQAVKALRQGGVHVGESGGRNDGRVMKASYVGMETGLHTRGGRRSRHCAKGACT